MEGGRVATVEVAGLELRCWERGSGPPLLLLHETAACADVWEPLAAELGEAARSIAFDRRGWGGSGAPEVYVRTTVEEQAQDAAAVLEHHVLGRNASPGGTEAARAVVCGAGIGAVAALDLLLRRPELVQAAVLVEPPLLAFLPDATEGLSADRQAIEEAFREGGAAAALDLYLGGGLPYLGPGAERIPSSATATARERPLSLFAELAAVPAWPIRSAELAAAATPSWIVVGASTPPLLRSAAERLGDRLGEAQPLRLEGPGLPHFDAAAELALQLRAAL